MAPSRARPRIAPGPCFYGCAFASSEKSPGFPALTLILSHQYASATPQHDVLGLSGCIRPCSCRGASEPNVRIRIAFSLSQPLQIFPLVLGHLRHPILAILVCTENLNSDVVTIKSAKDRI